MLILLANLQLIVNAPYLYLYLFFGVDDSIIDDFTQCGDHINAPNYATLY